MRARLILNPQAGRGAGRRLAAPIEACLAGLGLPTDASHSRHVGDLADQTEAACRAGYDPVIVAGGDGTVFEAVNGVMRAGSGTRLGIIPVGTGNDLIKAAGLPRDWREACRRVAAGATRSIDVGRCNDRYFANGIGAGFDAEVARDARSIRRLRGNIVYGVALLRVLARGVKAPRVTIEDEHGRIEDDITLVAVANGPWYGGAFHIAPGARIDDGLFDVVIAEAVGRLGVLRFTPRVLAGTHLSLPIVRHRRARRITVACSTGLCVHADGEILYDAAERLDIEVLPRALTLIA
jgi:diacylglycerol kinase (ATP)